MYLKEEQRKQKSVINGKHKIGQQTKSHMMYSILKERGLSAPVKRQILSNCIVKKKYKHEIKSYEIANG